jgi:hypothetical protein
MRRDEPLAVGPAEAGSGKLGMKLVEKLPLKQEVRLHDDPPPTLRGDFAERRFQSGLGHCQEARYSSANRSPLGPQRGKTVHLGNGFRIETAAADKNERRFVRSRVGSAYFAKALRREFENLILATKRQRL